MESEKATAEESVHPISKIFQPLKRSIRGIARTSNFFIDRWFWPLVALLTGTVPLLVSFLTGLGGHQVVSAMLLSGICLGLVWKDRWVAAIFAISLMFLGHSILAVYLAQHFPETCDQIMPKAREYWEQQRHWITTGENLEYELSTWVPAHITLFFGTTFYSFVSFGVLVFYEGLIQVDMMNFYNAQLAMLSESQVRSLGFGWHIWSLMRGIGYLFLTVEVISLSLAVFSQQKLSSRRNRIIRWSAGIGFLLTDCLIKLFAVEPVREKLYENLL